MRARARPLFLRTVFEILFRVSQSNGKRKSTNRYLSVEIHFWISRSIANPKSGFSVVQKSKIYPASPIERAHSRAMEEKLFRKLALSSFFFFFKI